MAENGLGGIRLTKASAFRIFKGVIFSILLLNLCFYLYEDVTAYLYLAPDSTFLDVLEGFAVTIDYVAWMVLIVLFEIETSDHASGRLVGTRKWVITGMTAACYVVLVYAAWGYAAALIDTYKYEAIEMGTVCDLVPEHFAYLSEDARPIELTQVTCESFMRSTVLKSPADNVITTQDVLLLNRKLGWVDVFNASAWLLIVLLFQVEVMLEQAKRLTKRIFISVTAVKIASYLVLFGCAVYWTIFSAFIDSWDAWLWLIAFVLIDLNLLGIDEDEPPDAIAVTAAA
jgi:hypothetical protein